MLHEFLVANRQKILDLAKTSGALTSAADRRGLPRFYDHLLRHLEREAKRLRKLSPLGHGPPPAGRHCRELCRSGYTVSQIGLGYAALCRAIVKLAQSTHTPISAREFVALRRRLDKAIAEAIARYAMHASGESADATKRMGFLVHELRNALTAAIVAHRMVKNGVVDRTGVTNTLLEKNLDRMRNILDHSVSEVRLEHNEPGQIRTLSLFKVSEEVAATMSPQASAKGLSLSVKIDPGLEVEGDEEYLISALANLVQNAIKYSKPGSVIQVRSHATSKHVSLEVEDRCGGLPEGQVEKLFKPFTQESGDRTGLGLGLTISRQAVERSGGTLTVRDLPKRGCIFTIVLPRSRVPCSPAKTSSVPAHAAR